MRDLISWRIRVRMGRRLARLADAGERGAVGVLVAVLIGTGVLFGMGALVVDVGQLYQNRAELQNGADAAALAVAKSCITGTCTPSVAAQYANANASRLTGGTADVNLVCGSGSLGGCPASTGRITDCPAPPAAGTNYVDVHTSTELANGSHLLPPVFARALAGHGTYQGSTVYACAQAEWGAPSTLTSVGITISACTWDQATNTGATFPPPPPATPAASFDQVLVQHGNTSDTGCPTEPAGADGPGNFGFTTGPNPCSVSVTGNTYPGNTGANANQCQTALYNAWSTRSVVYLPVYVSAAGPGNNLTFTLKGFAAFVVTGYYFPGQVKESDWLNSANNCKGSSFCLNGYFTQGLIPTLGSLGGTNLGAYIVRLTG